MLGLDLERCSDQDRLREGKVSEGVQVEALGGRESRQERED